MHRNRFTRALAALLLLALLLPSAAHAAQTQAFRSRQKLTVDGRDATCAMYRIGGNNYFKLRELGDLLGFEVGYDAATNTAMIFSESSKSA